MQLHEFWRMEYAIDTYLSHLSTDRLNNRAKYLIQNLTSLELNGKIGIRDITHEPGRSLMRKFTHVLQELHNRGEGLTPGFLDQSSIPIPMTGKANKLKVLNELANNKKPHLIKFGDKKYLEKFSFKLSLARTFNDPSLNIAQIDDEMRAVYTPHPNDVKITHMDGKPINGILSIEITLQAPRDYYIFCSSHLFDVRLFGDFEVDACLFIYDSQRFSDDILLNLSKYIDIEDHAYNPVTYIDPIKPEPGIMPPIEFHKHIEFLYQNEFRHVFIPIHKNILEENIILSMPEAATYSELICL